MIAPRGTIVYAEDPFKRGEVGRPWVIVNTSEMPFHGEQYVGLVLSTRTWYEERLPIADDDLFEVGFRRTVRSSRGRSARSIPTTSTVNSAGWTNAWSTTPCVHSRAISAFSETGR